MQRKIIFLSETCEGKMHDKKIADEQPIEFDKEITLLQDSGFIGHHPKNAKIKQPYKNSKLKKLTEEQKIENKEQASKRVRVEHSIGGVKRLRIVKDIFRNRRAGLIDLSMQIACGLHNLRLAA
jgi:hypothetical protein